MAMSRSKNTAFELTGKARQAVSEAAESYAFGTGSEESISQGESTNVASTAPEFATATKTSAKHEPAANYADPTQESATGASTIAPKKKKRGPKNQTAESSDTERKIRIPNTGIYFYEDQIARLRELSYLTQRSQSEIVREAFDYYLTEKVDK